MKWIEFYNQLSQEDKNEILNSIFWEKLNEIVRIWK